MASSARIEELRKKFEENPRRYFAPLANEYRKAGDIEQAISICREYLPQQPGHMSGHIVYGQALYEARQFDEAKSVFETALTLDPENLIALRHLGDISLMVGDGDAARAWYKRVLEADPRNEEIQAQLARIDQSGAPTPVAGTSAPTPGASTSLTPAVGSPTVPPITLVPSLSSAATVVVDPSKLPLPKSAAANASGAAPDPKTAEIPAPKSAPESLSTTPTAEIHLDPPKSIGDQPKRAAVDAPSVPRLELDSPVPGGSGRPTPSDSFSLAGLETTSLAAEPAQSEPAGTSASTGAADPTSAAEASAATAPPLELDMPPADALPMAAAAPPAPAPLADLELNIAAAPAESVLPASPRGSSQDPELLDLSLPAPTEAAASAAPSPSPDHVAPTPPNLDDLPLITDAVGEERAAPPEAGPFVTETMAELYLRQGHRDEALRVYRALLEQRAGDADLQAKIASLEAPKGPTMREVLTAVAMRRPGVRPANNGQKGPSTVEALTSAAPQATEPPTPAPDESAPPASAVSEPPRAMGVDQVGAFFGGKPIADADESAARTLALAFAVENGGGRGNGGFAGSPARVATKELSLDSVFSPSQAPATPSSFSFDQFFSKDAASGSTPTPAQSSADSPDDVAQFTSWLQGLKRK